MMLRSRPSLVHKIPLNSSAPRRLSTLKPVGLRRSYLYVPCSSHRPLEKSLTINSDVFIYDLEDSVSPLPSDKNAARERLNRFLQVGDKREIAGDATGPDHIAVRVNDISTPFFKTDISQIISHSRVRSLVLPKIHSGEDLDFVSDIVKQTCMESPRNVPLRIIPSIESAKGLWNIGNIAGWKSRHNPLLGGVISTLLFAAEDYCADTSIIRTSSLRELLYTRSQIVVAAKAFGLEAIDMVCVNYKDNKTLELECIDGRNLGFSGKQAIHPAQVEIIQSIFVPTRKEIIRAAKIVREMRLAYKSERGAVGLDGEMIDAPMLKQAQRTIEVAEAAGLEIPSS